MIDVKSIDDMSSFLDTLESAMKKRLKDYSSLSITDLAALDAELNIYQDLIDLGYEDRVQQFLDSYQTAINEALDLAEKAGVKGLSKISFDDIQFIKEADYNALLGKAQTYAEQVKGSLMVGYISGMKPNEILGQLNTIPLKDYQLNQMLNTFYADISRAAVAKVFKNDKSQRFRYNGPIVEHSSEECKWLIMNQREEGYTKAEIDNGIETPFKYKSGELAGQIKKIYWSGRKPNNNCLHEWIPVTSA